MLRPVNWALGPLAITLQVAGCSALGEPETADFVISGARLILEDGSMSSPSSLVIADGMIQSIVDGDAEVMAERRVDVGGKIVLPGYIDTHVHLLFRSAAKNQESLDDWVENDLQDVLEPYLTAGITSIMSMGDYYPTILDVRNSISVGKLKGPRTFVVGPVFTAPGGHPAGTLCRTVDWCKKTLAIEVEDPEIARQRVRELAEAGVDGIKVAYSGNGPFPKTADPVFIAIAEEATAQGLRAFVHSSLPKDFVQARELGATRFAHAPAMTAFPELDSPSSMFAGLPVATSPGVPKRDAFKEQWSINLRKLIDWGALITLGTDLPSKTPADALAMEIEALQAALTPEEIIAALTVNAALFVGMEDRLGKVAVGYLADLVVVDGEPLKDAAALTNVVMVVKNGEVVTESATKQ